MVNPNYEVINVESIWEKEIQMPSYAPLEKDIKVHTAVIGGGMAGILTAYLLQKQGDNVVVLEAERIASGQTKHTTAKITSQHNLIYHKLLQSLGEERAKLYANANQEAIGVYRNLAKQLTNACAFEEKANFLYATQSPASIEEEAQAMQRLGLKAKFVTQTELPFPVTGAVKLDGQAQFQPLAFLKEIAENLTIYENTMVRDIEAGVIKTNHGNVQAAHIVMATHYPFINAPGFYFAREHQERSYVLALQHAKQYNGMYLGVDEPAYSFRNAGEYLLFGGAAHRTGKNRAGGHYEQLRKAAREYYPNATETAFWSAQDCMTLDGIPYIGQYAPSLENMYVATGFNKWGMTSSMVAAMLLSDHILGKENPYEAVFTPHRTNIKLSAKQALKDGAHAIRGLAAGFMAPPRAAVKNLPKGHGGIVEVDGKKMGVYKDDVGTSHIVQAQCTHLGCQLEWNPDEKSWDCPCHGSRFDYKGNLMDNPAMEGLKYDTISEDA